MTKAQFLEKSKDVLGEQAGMMGEALFRSIDDSSINRRYLQDSCRILL